MVLRNKIIELRQQGKSYREIEKELQCSKSMISIYCRKSGLGGDGRTNLSDEDKRIANYQHVKSHRQKIKERAIEYKGGKCEKCGYKKCNRALEFHHTSPNEKDFTISKYSVLSWNKVKIELDKCILICANCHRELHDDEYLNNRDVFPLSDKQ
jgi:hypothetical protein